MFEFGCLLSTGLLVTLIIGGATVHTRLRFGGNFRFLHRVGGLGLDECGVFLLLDVNRRAINAHKRRSAGCHEDRASGHSDTGGCDDDAGFALGTLLGALVGFSCHSYQGCGMGIRSGEQGDPHFGMRLIMPCSRRRRRRSRSRGFRFRRIRC